MPVLNPKRTRVTEAIWKVIGKNIQHLSWQCGKCTKVKECEEKESTVTSNGFEPRYCQSLIEAALNDEREFQVPFPRALQS